MRALFEDVIKLRNEDPLLPETWYNLSSADMRQVKASLSPPQYIHLFFITDDLIERWYGNKQVQQLLAGSSESISGGQSRRVGVITRYILAYLLIVHLIYFCIQAHG